MRIKLCVPVPEIQTKKQWIWVLLVLGCLFLVQSAVMAAQFRWKTVPPEAESLAGSLFGWVGCWLWASYLSSETGRKRRLKVALIVLVVVYVSGGLTFSAVRFFHNRRVEAQARQLFTQAQEDAKPTWSEDDAIRWFHDHRILDARRGVGSHATEWESEQYYLVSGVHPIEDGGLVFRPASVEVEFIFDNVDHTFKRAEYQILPFKAEKLR